jgi:hypothetical protein
MDKSSAPVLLKYYLLVKDLKPLPALRPLSSNPFLNKCQLPYDSDQHD